MSNPTFRILGDLEVVGRNGLVPVGGRRRRTLLAYLLTRSGGRTSLDAICDAVWDGAPSDAAGSTVRTYVSQFRRLDVDGDGLVFQPDASGYRISLARDALDATLFEDLLVEALGKDAPTARLSALEDALSLWRGPALAEFVDADWARDVARHLTERRKLAEAERFDVLLRLGRHAECVAPLATAVAAAPYDERAAGQLALARYRSGQLSDGLAELGGLRRRLRDDLGLEPSAEIVDLERRMLDRDPGLSPGGSEAAVAPARGPNRSSATLGPQLPGGTVTFLFTDIQASTQMLTELGDDTYADVLGAQRELIRAAVQGHRGTVFGHEGDAVFAVFAAAPNAVAAAADAQQAIGKADWPSPMRVRMGLHTGNVLVVDDDYVGTTVHVAARVAATAHGGQVVASEACRSLAPDARWQDLGTHRLKDVDGAQHLYQLSIDGEQFPPLPTAENVPSNLPEPLDSFIGREDALDTVSALLHDARLVSLVGPGGVGKSRLAIETARTVRGRHAGGIHLVELAQEPAGGDVAGAVVRTLVDNGARGADLGDLIADVVGDGTSILVLDNCEHVLEGSAALVTELLGAEPNLRVLATTREPLRVRGEHVHHVDALSLEGDDGGRSPAELLFEARAEAATGRPVAEEDRPDVRRICAELDGLPLAIELAASRTTSLALVDIANRLDDRFALLRSSRAGDDDRHRTLGAVVDWSYELLSPPDRSLFNRLAVFGDAFTLDAAEAVAAGDDVPGDYVIDGLTHLVDKSLVRRTTIEGAPAYRMLETLRAYGRSRLDEAGLTEVAEGRLIGWAMSLTERLEADMRTERQDASLRASLPHRGNLRTALELQRRRGRVVEALRIVASAPLDVAPERCRLIDELLAVVERSDHGQREEAMARAHLAASNLEFERGQFEAGAEHARRGRELFGHLGEERSVAWSSFLETFGAWGIGDVDRARGAIGDARERFADLDDRLGLANAAWVAILLDPDLDRADELGAEAERELRSIDSPFALAHCLESRALVDLQLDHPAQAAPRLAEALEIFVQLRNQGCAAHCLEAAAAYTVAIDGDGSTTAELLGAAEALRSASGHRHRPWELEGQRAALAALRACMADDELEAAIAVGRVHRLESAHALGARVFES